MTSPAGPAQPEGRGREYNLRVRSVKTKESK